MLRPDKIVKWWKDAAAQCDQINGCGFWNRGLGLPLASRVTGAKLPFSGHLAILFKVYQRTLRLIPPSP
jgi:hypothetical protein